MMLSIVIPCYNEEKRLGKTLKKIEEYIRLKPFSVEILVVDNGSKDNTAGVVADFQKHMPNLRIINRQSHGKGYAVREGMLAATGDYRLFVDADNSTDIVQADKLLGYIDQGYDVVIGSRKIEGAVITHKQPWYRNVLGTLFAFTVKLMVPLGIKDTQNGFKLFSRRASEKIFPHQTIFYWAFDVEILALARIFNFKIREVPIVWVNDERSRMNIRGMIRMLFEVVLIRLYLSTRVYTK